MHFYANARMLRVTDGADEVHRRQNLKLGVPKLSLQRGAVNECFGLVSFNK